MTTTSEQTRIAELENALRQAHDAIMKAAEDTLWCEDSPAETVVDRIDAVLGGEAETAELFPTLPSPPVSGEAVCPRSANGRPESFKVRDCVAAGECGCGESITPGSTVRASPLTNEPVGVTLPQDDASFIAEMLTGSIEAHRYGRHFVHQHGTGGVSDPARQAEATCFNPDGGTVMGKLTERQRDFLTRIMNNRMLRPADREEDRVRQSCRRLGLCKFGGNPKNWHILPAGRAALEGE